MEKRRFGKTNAEVSIINIGGFGPGADKDPKKADEMIQLAFDSGINMVDCAPSYADAEVRLGPWMPSYRDKIFLAEKTTERTKEGAWGDLRESMKKLQVDKFDLYQFHAVKSLKELDQIFAPGGAMEAFQEAKESDLFDYIGITGHDDIRVFIEALHRYDFDTVLAPVSLAHEANPHPTNDFHPLLELAKEKDVGIQAIKSSARRRWDDYDKRWANTWYEPLREEDWIRRALRYTLSRDGVTTAPMSGDLTIWPMLIQTALDYSAPSDEEIQETIRLAKTDYGMKPLFPV